MHRLSSDVSGFAAQLTPPLDRRTIDPGHLGYPW
jgi:hypothetical protein